MYPTICTLDSIEKTKEIAKSLAKAILDHSARALFFSGPLGSGKTTLIAAIVSNLPGSENAQVSSPSFSLCNYYPLTPPCLHCDLYRVKDMVPTELLEALEDEETVVFLEWAQYLPKHLWPKSYILCTLSPAPSRSITIECLS